MTKLFHKNKNYMELSSLANTIPDHYFSNTHEMRLGVIPVYLNLCELLLPRISTELCEY